VQQAQGIPPHEAEPTDRGRLICLVLVYLLAASAGMAFDYTDERSKAVKACEAIDASEYQSGLFFNPDGYRSYYLRSKCFQDAAVRFRDPNLCDQVKQRRALLSSSWGYSASRCRQLVAEGAAVDRTTLEGLKAAYVEGGMRLSDFRIERNGNGRDIDIIPSFTGSFAHSYTLTFEILLDASGASVLLHSSGYYVDEKSNLRIYVPQADIKKKFSGFSQNRVYAVRATATLDVGFGGQSGYWSPAFIKGVFPTPERSKSITRRAMF
jgi:hypothetical protein